jgi:hypothetical protein
MSQFFLNVRDTNYTAKITLQMSLILIHCQCKFYTANKSQSNHMYGFRSNCDLSQTF